MTPVVIRYPLDPTGTNPNNLVQGEVHQMVRRKVRAIATTYGAFFTESVKVVDTATNKELVRGQQYVASEMYEEPTARFGKEVCSIILITDTTVSDAVSLQYQAVGGPFSNSVKAIEQLITALSLDDRPVSKNSIIDWPSEFPPSHHLHDVGDTYGWEYVVTSLNRLLTLIQSGSTIKYDALYAYIDMVCGQVTPAVVQAILNTVNAAMAAHLADPDPHHQYLLRTEAASLAMALVKKPVDVSPFNGAMNTGVQVTLQLTPFYSLYGIPQNAMEVRLSRNVNCAAPYDLDTTLGAVNSYQLPQLLQPNTTYYWQGRMQDTDGVWSDWSDPSAFGTGSVYVNQPSVNTPVNGSTVNTNGLSLTASAFGTTGQADTQKSADWEIWTGPNGSGSKVFSSYNDTANLNSIAVAAGVLANNATYYPRVRYTGVVLPASAWSASKSFTVAYPVYPTIIGQAYGGGFFAGNITLTDGNYAVILAPKATGEKTITMGSSNTTQINATSTTDSAGDTQQYNAVYPSTTYGAAWVRALNIAGYTDWQVPAKDVLALVMKNLGQTTATVTPYKAGGAEVMDGSYYWTSTSYNWVQTSSYTVQNPDTPIYGYTTTGFTEYGPDDNSPSCGTGPNGDSGYSVQPGSYSPISGSSPASASWWCTKTAYGITGYQPGGTSTYYTNTNKYQIYAATNAGASTYLDRTSANVRVRAIRLVKIV